MLHWQICWILPWETKFIQHRTDVQSGSSVYLYAYQYIPIVHVIVISSIPNKSLVSLPEGSRNNITWQWMLLQVKPGGLLAGSDRYQGLETHAGTQKNTVSACVCVCNTDPKDLISSFNLEAFSGFFGCRKPPEKPCHSPFVLDILHPISSHV